MKLTAEKIRMEVCADVAYTLALDGKTEKAELFIKLALMYAEIVKLQNKTK